MIAKINKRQVEFFFYQPKNTSLLTAEETADDSTASHTAKYQLSYTGITLSGKIMTFLDERNLS